MNVNVHYNALNDEKILTRITFTDIHRPWHRLLEIDYTEKEITLEIDYIRNRLGYI